MTNVRQILLLAALLTSRAQADEQAPRITAGPSSISDFKLKIDMFGVHKVPIATAELVVRRGTTYQFVAGFPEEITILEPGQSRVHLLDLRRKVRSMVSARWLDAGMDKMRQKAAALSGEQTRSGGKANLVSAAMSRDLFEPRLRSTFDAKARRLVLTNPSIEIEALGESETDDTRRQLIRNCLTTLAKLDAIRESDVHPPFARLDTFTALSDEFRLRPTEVSVLYRLAGNPKKWRWTYQLVPALTDREREAIARVDAMWTAAPFLPLRRYEEEGAEER